MQQPVYYRLSRTERIPLGARYVDIPDAFVAAALMACGGFVVAFILFSMLPLDWAGFPSVGRPEIFRFADWYRSLDVAHQASFDLRVSLALVIGIFGFVLGLWVGFQPKQTDQHIGGSQFMDGAAAIKAMRVATETAIERTGQGIHLHPELPISLDTEAKHFMLVGAPGSGKTQTPLRQTSCRLAMILNFGAKRVDDGKVRRSIQEQSGGTFVAAGKRSRRRGGERDWGIGADLGTLAR